jgi:hypothetical protein
MVQSAGVNAHEDFVGPDKGFVYIGVVEDAGVTMLVKHNRFHKKPPQTGMFKNGLFLCIVSRYVEGRHDTFPAERYDRIGLIVHARRIDRAGGGPYADQHGPF